LDLCSIDERNVGFYRVDDELNVQVLEPEDIQANFLRAESALGPNVPIKLRERIAVARNLAAYACFSYEFYAVSILWSVSCMEMGLHIKFAETHAGPLKLTNRKLKTSEVAPLSYEVEDRLRRGWRIDGLPNFNFSFKALLDWAQKDKLLPSEANFKSILGLRNQMAHPSYWNGVQTPGAAIDVFELLIWAVVKLWPSGS